MLLVAKSIFYGCYSLFKSHSCCGLLKPFTM